jgi:xanthine dehydrogenase YagT iron-sulfur-binding subunit
MSTVVLAIVAANDQDNDGFTRRRFFGGAAAVSAGIAVGTEVTRPAPAQAAGAPRATTVSVTCTVNGTSRQLTADPRVTLLDALRERWQLTGTKKGCDRGQCGACTVHVNGRRVVSCLTLLATVNGQQVTTIEGLAGGGTVNPVQQAFLDDDGMQCGFCTPGQVMSAVALLAVNPHPTIEEARRAMSGNLCRCGSYNQYLAGVMRAAKGG